LYRWRGKTGEEGEEEDEEDEEEVKKEEEEQQQVGIIKEGEQCKRRKT
jgi:hypothetical protein